MRRSKLSEDARRMIWQAYQAGESRKEIADTFGISTGLVYQIGNEERYLLGVMRSVRKRLKRLRALRSGA